MCHQSVGLISRAIEAKGIPTLSLTSAWSITASANPPRAAYTDFPLGHTAGRPNQPAEQSALIRDALTQFEAIETPGTIIPLGYGWDRVWKDEARELIDHRTTRRDTPQYQNEADRLAAMANHGQTVACTVCEPGLIPRS